LVYNEIVKIPWWGFPEAYEKKKIYLKNRAAKHHISKDEPENDYLGFSPGAVYDQSHFKRKTDVEDDVSMSVK